MNPQPHTSTIRYPALEAYYHEAPHSRGWSPEVDYGVHWTWAARRWPVFRLSWVERTGELITVDQSTRGHPVMVWAVMETRSEAEATLAGWENSCGPGGLDWLVARLETVGLIT